MIPLTFDIKFFTCVVPQPTCYFIDPVRHWFHHNNDTENKFINDVNLTSNFATLQQIEEFYPSVSTIFVAVNPWYMWYENYLNVKKLRIDNPTIFPTVDMTSFKTFVEPAVIMKEHFVPQKRWATYESKQATHIFKYETLAEEFKVIQKYFNCNKELAIPQMIEYQQYYTEDIKDMVYEICKEDIDWFNYTFDNS